MATTTYTFVGVKRPDDWALESFQFHGDTINRGDEVDMEDWEYKQASKRFKLVEGTGHLPDPIVNPGEAEKGDPGDPANVELAYAEITAQFVKNPANVSPGDDVPGLAIAVTFGVRPVMLEFWAIQVFHSAAGGGPLVLMWDVEANAAVCMDSEGPGAVGGYAFRSHMKRRVNGVPGTTKNYKIKIGRNAVAGQVTLLAGVQYPSYISATQV